LPQMAVFKAAREGFHLHMPDAACNTNSAMTMTRKARVSLIALAPQDRTPTANSAAARR
jgi:hypothetical protein